jgi:multicomponent Na+:H+ antiporter subunit E
MTQIVAVLLLTGVWTALFATTDLRAIGFGAIVSAVILWFTGRLEETNTGTFRKRVIPRPTGLVLLAFAFFFELVKSAVSVAKEAWRPKLAVKPGVIRIPLRVESDVEITMLASLISLTPGTLSLDVSPDGGSLYVHALIIDDDGSEIRQSIARRLERPVRRAFFVERDD